MVVAGVPGTGSVVPVAFGSYRGDMRFWQDNRSLIGWTVAVAVALGLVFAVLTTPRGGLLVGGSVLAIVGILVLSSATMRGSEQTLDRQIRDRERRSRHG